MIRVSKIEKIKYRHANPFCVVTFPIIAIIKLDSDVTIYTIPPIKPPAVPACFGKNNILVVKKLVNKTPEIV